MTEASDDGNYLVRVHAQVMTRDDSSGGWVPLSGGGLANVSVRRRITPSGVHQINNTNGTTISTSTNPTHAISNAAVGLQSHGSSNISPSSANKRKHEYLIYGKRITDQSVVLSCTIKKDFEYNKVMPTFHHWRTGEKKFGLTFQTAADARAFDKGVRTAVEELLEGLSDLTLTTDVPDAGDEDVFMTLNLPVEPLEPRSSSDTPHRIRVPNYSQYSDLPDSHRSIHSSIKAPPPQHPLVSAGDIGSDNYPYVQLTTLNHEYLYPIIDDHKSERLDGHNTSSSRSPLKKLDTIISQPLKNTVKRNVRLRCKHCQELYSEQHNPKGSCEYAPDPIRRGIATVSCLSCAQCMLYHCMSDAEGDFAQNPCRVGRWLILWIHGIIVDIWNWEELPEEMEIDVICPLHKKGDQLECKNYKAVVFLNTIHKILSRTCCSTDYVHMQKNV